MTETTHSTGPRCGAWPMTARTNEKSIATSTTTLTVRHVSTGASLHPPWAEGRPRPRVSLLSLPNPSVTGVGENEIAPSPAENGLVEPDYRAIVG